MKEDIDNKERIVRAPLPVELIRRLDRALEQRVGGFETRAEFIREAVENMLLEYSYDPAPPEPAAVQGMEVEIKDYHENGSARIQTPNLAATALTPPPERGIVFDEGLAEVEQEPLFGMHSRDYPSVWALRKLAELTFREPLVFSDYLEEVTRLAWTYAEELEGLEQQVKSRLRVMFPRNSRKRESSEAGFKASAVGAVSRKELENGHLSASGPLFAWQACQVQRKGDELLIAPTHSGYRLLEALEGISLELPHSPKIARNFLDHLRRFSPGDCWGFKTLLDAVSQEPDRSELLDHFRKSRPEWPETVVGTNAQGYLGRAREWGLVEPKQIQGRYLLTDFGGEVLDG